MYCLFSFKAGLYAQIAKFQTWMAADIVDSFLLFFSFLFYAALVFFFDLQESIVVSMWALGLI